MMGGKASAEVGGDDQKDREMMMEEVVEESYSIY